MTDEVKVVLVVDDSRTARMMIRSIVLHLHPHWIVLEAGSGAEALEVVERDTPNYVTMDISMPGMDGIEAAKAVIGKYPNTHIVLFTANMQESTRQTAREMGVNLVAKPITEQSVLQALAILGS